MKADYMLVLILLLVTVTLIGCGGDIKEPTPKTQDDLMLMEKIVGAWDVISVNDIEPSRFLTVLMVKALEIPDDGIQEDIGIPAAPIGDDRFEVVDIIEDEINEVYSVKVDIDDFHYTFNMDARWTLRVQFDILPNDEAVPPNDEAASDPGEGGQDPPPDPNKQAPPANGTPEVIAVVVGTWSGTYSVMRDVLSLTIEAEDVKVTPHPDAKAFFEELTDDTETDAQEELTHKFRIRLVNPFSKTFISVEDTLILKAPGSSHGKIILEKRADDQ